jgi:FtsP/CotA-like multicopper oxidase with cupredoxin domain
MLVVPAVLIAVGLAVALPAQARAGSFSGIVVAKQRARGTMLIAGAHGVGFTVRGSFARARVGDRVAVNGVRLHDGTVHASRVRVLSHVRRATLRGTVVRRMARGTLLASGHSVVLIHPRNRRLASASDHGDRGELEPGDVARFRIRFDDDDMFEEGQPVQLGQTNTARIEGTIVSLSPFVVSLEGLPVTITVPDGTTMPPSLAPGQRIELTVQVGSGNTLTLVAIDEVENDNQGDDGGRGDGDGGHDGGGGGGDDGGGHH